MEYCKNVGVDGQNIALDLVNTVDIIINLSMEKCALGKWLVSVTRQHV